MHSTDIYWAFIMEARDDVGYSNSLRNALSLHDADHEGKTIRH